MEAAASLHYLVDLDAHLISDPPNAEVLGHAWDMVDRSHARWATTVAITALDLCASALAHANGLITPGERV
jgi:hypothetical protein